MDVKTAFLNEKIQEDFYTKHAPGFETTDKTSRQLMMNLRESLYGLRQSSSV